jgi:hypothetical protein
MNDLYKINMKDKLYVKNSDRGSWLLLINLQKITKF